MLPREGEGQRRDPLVVAGEAGSLVGVLLSALLEERQRALDGCPDSRRGRRLRVRHDGGAGGEREEGEGEEASRHSSGRRRMLR